MSLMLCAHRLTRRFLDYDGKNKKVKIFISAGQSASLIVSDGWAAFVFVFVFGGLLHQAAWIIQAQAPHGIASSSFVTWEHALLMGKRQSVSVFKIVWTSAFNFAQYVYPLLSGTTKFFEEDQGYYLALNLYFWANKTFPQKSPSAIEIRWMDSRKRKDPTICTVVHLCSYAHLSPPSFTQ